MNHFLKIDRVELVLGLGLNIFLHFSHEKSLYFVGSTGPGISELFIPVDSGIEARNHFFTFF